MNKKLILGGIGSLSALVPIASVVSCANDSKFVDYQKTIDSINKLHISASDWAALTPLFTAVDNASAKYAKDVKDGAAKSVIDQDLANLKTAQEIADKSLAIANFPTFDKSVSLKLSYNSQDSGNREAKITASITGSKDTKSLNNVKTFTLRASDGYVDRTFDGADKPVDLEAKLNAYFATTKDADKNIIATNPSSKSTKDLNKIFESIEDNEVITIVDKGVKRNANATDLGLTVDQSQLDNIIGPGFGKATISFKLINPVNADSNTFKITLVLKMGSIGIKGNTLGPVIVKTSTK